MKFQKNGMIEQYQADPYSDETKINSIKKKPKSKTRVIPKPKKAPVMKPEKRSPPPRAVKMSIDIMASPKD